MIEKRGLALFIDTFVVEEACAFLCAHPEIDMLHVNLSATEFFHNPVSRITEIVKRLFRSERLKALFPEDHDRIRHIMTKQVYGMAPTRIIFLIATNYILGFDDSLKLETKNFVQADAAEAAKNGTLGELVERHFG